MSKVGMLFLYVLACHCLIVSSNPVPQGFFSRLFQNDYVQNVRNILPFSKSRLNTNNAKPVDAPSYESNAGFFPVFNPELRPITPHPRDATNTYGAGIDFSRSEELQGTLIKNNYKATNTHNKEQKVGAPEQSHSADNNSDFSECLHSKDPKCEEQRKFIEYIFNNRDRENDIDKETTTVSYDTTTMDDISDRISAQVIASLLG